VASGEKTKLLMTRYKVSAEGSITLEPSVRYEALINPAEFRHNTGIRYDGSKTLGEAVNSPKFASVSEETVSFSLVLDGTGVLPGSGGQPVSVKSQIAQLNTVVYNYVGSQHEPPHVRLLWGTWIFFGRLQSMTTQYTLFKPSGEPLRAKLDLSFIGSMSQQEGKLVANRSSPDLTHSVVVRQGDTLPLLCQRIYGDPGYYLDVAAFNGLSSFRDLPAGSQLHFPPLE
jgi:hypothetical protein